MAKTQSSLSPIEKEVFKSFTEHEIISFIRSRSETEAQKEFHDTIRYCIITCGIKEMPDQVVDGNLYKLLTSQYNTYTFNEIRKAVYMNSIGELQQRHEHFGLFDTTFLSKVMADWSHLKMTTKKRAASLLPAPVHKIETPESLYNGLVSYVKKNQSFPISWNWNAVYNYMDEGLLIEESNESKRALMAQIEKREQTKLELEKMTVASFFEREKIEEEFTEKIKLLCRKELIMKYLQYLIK